ncbi:hypothetical protein KFL_001810130 [Klebsormidium nitens]|uniref:Pre-mRNA polyadenylation factor Fip1 domain-containing protein n=1 Tax=Klebsormidium nitens TaxID=105231 RepID=A0A1Y1I2P2_KLENI|nr:hypothetical protein KFL_001810130 [Klebsormidium nitens]|eukprot:GAQ84232.1 hypothetical protein KFL_001810130 [Klebsormidium nitens]
MADDAELEAALFGEETPILEAAAPLVPLPFGQQFSTPTPAEGDGARSLERGTEEGKAGSSLGYPLKPEEELRTKAILAREIGLQAERIIDGSEVAGKMDKQGDGDDLHTALYGAGADDEVIAEEERASIDEQNGANKPQETEAAVATTRVGELPAPDAEDEDDLYGELYGDVDGEPLLGGEEAPQLTAETGQVNPAVNQVAEPGAFGSLPVEEDVAKLAAVVGLTAPEVEEEEDSDSEDSDSEDDFEILVNDDHLRPAVGHTAMPPISRVPARAERDGDEESDSDSDGFTIILDDEGAGPAAGMKRGLEDEPGLQREYSLKSLPSSGVAGPKPADQALEERPVQDVSQMQNGMQYGGRGGRRWGQQQRGNDVYFPNASHVFDLNLEELEMKPWRFAGTDVSDYFNFELNEQTWHAYCQQLAQARLEQTMQSKIRVYESRTANGPEADPDLPPELASLLNLDTGGQQQQMGRPNAFQAHRGGPTADLRRFRPRDADAVIEIQVQSDVAPPSAPKTAIVDREEHRSVEPAPETALALEGGSGETAIGDGSERMGQAELSNGGDQTERNTSGIKEELVGEREAELVVKEEAEETRKGSVEEGKEPLGKRGEAPEDIQEKLGEVKLEAGEGAAEPIVKQERSDGKELAPREHSRSPSRSRLSTPPEKSEGPGGRQDRLREQRGLREPSRDRPLSRGDGRPFLPRPGPTRPPFVPGGPVGAPERPPYWGEEPGFRPPFPPYGPAGAYFDGPYWGMQGPGFPPGPDGPFYGPNGGQFYPPGPFEPGMRPPFGPVDGPWGQPYPGTRPGPVPRPLPGRGPATGASRARRKEEKSSSEETSSEESSSESESGSESGSYSGSESSSDDSRRKSRRPVERSRAKPGPYPPATVRFDEFGRPLPAVRVVYDDFGRPIELDPFGRPLDPRRAAEYDEFMRHQFEGRRDGMGGGAGFGGRGPGWFGEGRGPGEFRGRGGRGRDGRLPDEVYAARRRERDERLAREERDRQERERRLRGEREPDRSLDRERFARDERRREGFEGPRLHDRRYREDEEERVREDRYRGASRGVEEGGRRDGRSRGVSRGLDGERWREDRHRGASRGLEEDRLPVRETGDYRDGRARDHNEVRDDRPERDSRQRGARAEREESREGVVGEGRGGPRRERSDRRRDASADDAARNARREHLRDERTPERKRGGERRMDDRNGRYAAGADSEEELGGRFERSRRRGSTAAKDGGGVGSGREVVSDDKERQVADDVIREGDDDGDVMETRDGRQRSGRGGRDPREGSEQRDGKDGVAEYGDNGSQLDEDDLVVADRRFRAGEMGAPERAQIEGEKAEERGTELGGELEGRNEEAAADGAGGDEEGGGESREERRRRRKERRHRHKEEREGDENEEEREERRRRRRDRKERERGPLNSQGREPEADHRGPETELGSPTRKDGFPEETTREPWLALEREEERPKLRNLIGRSDERAVRDEEEGLGGDERRRAREHEVGEDDNSLENKEFGENGGAEQDGREERRRRKEERRRRHKERKEWKEQELEKDANGQAVEESERKHRHRRHRQHREEKDERPGEEVEAGVQEGGEEERREKKRHRGQREEDEAREVGVREGHQDGEDETLQRQMHGGEDNVQRGEVREEGGKDVSRQDRGGIGEGMDVEAERGAEEVNEGGFPGEKSDGRKDRKRRRKHRHRNEEEGEEEREERRRERKRRKHRGGEEGHAVVEDAEAAREREGARIDREEGRKERSDRRGREHEEGNKSRAREESVGREVSKELRGLRTRDVDTAGFRNREGDDVGGSVSRGDVSRERRQPEPGLETRTGRGGKTDGSGGDSRKDQREGPDKEPLSDFEAKLKRRAERFGPLNPIEEEAPRGSTRRDESVTVKDRLSRRIKDRSPPRAVVSAAAAERVTGFMDVDRPEEELPYLVGTESRDDGLQRKRKRERALENGTEEGRSQGGRDWNEAKFRITGLGAPAKLTSTGGQNGTAKRKVVGTTEGSEASRPQRVVIQDSGVKDSGDVARKRMFQQALAGVGGLSRSLSNKGGGRNDM